jgi:hypothetical protein
LTVPIEIGIWLRAIEIASIRDCGAGTFHGQESKEGEPFHALDRIKQGA